MLGESRIVPLSLEFFSSAGKGSACNAGSEVARSCPTLCDPVDGSLPGSAVHGIFQARILEWAAISFSRGSSQPRDRTRGSCIADRCFTVWATREASKTPVQFLGWEDSLRKGMAIHSSILAWRHPMDRGAWQAAVHGVTKSQTWLSD